MPTTKCNIEARHCENCGSTDPEDVSPQVCDNGYTACCNECVAYSDDCRGHHNHR